MWDGKRELTTEEKTKPYSKYYDYQIAKPMPELMAEVSNGPMNYGKILEIEKINDLLNNGYHEVETGWCQCPDGTAYVAAHCHMPGVTKDMIEWWFAWHGLEDLRYMLWWPPQHYGIYIKEEDKEKIKKPYTPMCQRFQGITHYVVENIGHGVSELKISFLSPEDFGFDMARFHEPSVSTFVGGNVLIYPPGKSMGVPVGCNVLCHFIRDVAGGVEFRSRFWFGYQIIQKKPVKMLSYGEVIPQYVPEGLAKHAVEEFAQLGYILPEIYQENWQKPF